jgi:ubiquinone/menaquinone biosynthesis C-methylase UbiE
VFLDTSCGEGALRILVQERYEKVIGVDVAQVRLGRAREKAGEAAIRASSPSWRLIWSNRYLLRTIRQMFCVV